MSNLYELTGNYKNLMDLFEDDTIETEIITEALLQNQEDIKKKAENYCRVIRNLEADVKALKEEEKRLADRRKAKEKKIQLLKQHLYDAMKATDNQKIKGNVFTLNIQKNPPSLYMEHMEGIPEECKSFTVTIDKKAVLELLKAGEQIEGCKIEQGESLRIR